MRFVGLVKSLSWLVLLALLGLLAWGIIDARLTFGAMPQRLTVIFDGT